MYLTVSFARFIIFHLHFVLHLPDSLQNVSDIFTQYLILVVGIIPSLLQQVYLVLHGFHPLVSLFPSGLVNILLASALVPPLHEAPNFITFDDKSSLILVSYKLWQFRLCEFPEDARDLISHNVVNHFMIEPSMLFDVLAHQGIHIRKSLFNTPKNIVRNIQ